MKIIVATIIASLSAGSASSGTLDAVVSDTTPTPVAVPSLQGTDWTGGYVGLQYGQGDAEASLGGETAKIDGDGFGVHAGYLHDLGQYVLGGELSFDRLNVDGDNAEVDLLRLRGRAGYDLGRFMPYVTLGVARYSSDEISETGFTYGVGGEYLVNDQFGIGLEYSVTSFGDVGGMNGLDLDIDMIQVRASYRF